jgi:hypothetical protein
MNTETKLSDEQRADWDYYIRWYNENGWEGDGGRRLAWQDLCRKHPELRESQLSPFDVSLCAFHSPKIVSNLSLPAPFSLTTCLLTEVYCLPEMLLYEHTIATSFLLGDFRAAFTNASRLDGCICGESLPASTQLKCPF